MVVGCRSQREWIHCINNVVSSQTRGIVSTFKSTAVFGKDWGLIPPTIMVSHVCDSSSRDSDIF